MADEETTPTPPPVEEPTTAPPAPADSEAVANEPVTETLPAEAQTAQPETQTAQMGRNEPIGLESAPVDGPLPPEPEPIAPTPAPEPPQAASAPVPTHPSRDLLVKARATIQDRKRKKLEKIMEALNAKGKITNDEVEKLLHVSDATATRYLSQLEKDGKIKQVGKTGKGVSYSRL